MTRTKKWKVAKKESEDLTKQLLYNRGLKTEEAQELFLNPPKPTLSYLKEYSKVDKNTYQKAIERILTAIENQEKIIVYGDYDVDGITGTTILWETIYYMGGNCLPYIPDRESEGYGLNIQAIEKLSTDGVDLIITVDCGITNVQEVVYANEKNIDIIVTDHHQKGKELPPAYAVFYDDTLVGASVAWFLAEGLIEARKEKGLEFRKPLELNQNWDLAALGTIADLQPLLDKNRSFAYWGLKELNKTKRLGLLKLIERAQLSLGELETYHVGFILAPRLNASGRLHDALSSVRLLCTHQELEAMEFADSISKLNIQRQELTYASFEQAEIQVAQNKDQKLFVLAHESWHEGIVGLVASRVKEKYYRPAVAISVQEGIGKGSARSIAGFNIIETLREAQEYLLGCGGHPMAAGFTIDPEKIELFTEKLQAIAEKNITDEMLEDILAIDAQISLDTITKDFLEKISKFKPFGVGNPEPLFLASKVTVVEARQIGKDKSHLKLRVRDQGQAFEVLAFGKGERFNEVSEGTLLEIVFSVYENTWNGVTTINLKSKDFKVL